MHDALFHDQQHLDDASLRERATTLGLKMKQYDACLASPIADTVKQDEAGGKAVAIKGTPTFVLRNRASRRSGKGHDASVGRAAGRAVFGGDRQALGVNR